MSSVQALREFINERLIAAAGEIFTVVEQTIVQYEEEIDRQRRQRESGWKPQMELHRTASPQQLVSEEQQLCGASLTQEEASSPGFKLEDEEPEHSQTMFPLEDFSSAEEERLLALKQETDSSALAFAEASSDHGEPEPDIEGPLFDGSAADRETVVHADASLILNVEPKPNKACRGDGVNNSHPPDKRKKAKAGKKCLKCGFCGKPFKCISKMLQHHRIHTGEKPYSCQMCEKSFRRQHHLAIHMRTHTGEKPYSCQICGKTFRRQHHLVGHTKTHQGERTYHICNICGKSYSDYMALKKHLVNHPGSDSQP
ncbi:zinc finger protein 570-like [Salarias fasciatus]|uniref:zinc finger protein 570-like n=1 Tax=Salarias fasciatus TaxID=181472 RepID=UPI00117700C2|nr:zinc finger protein 570-like [Salarias fasciatus]XP_029974674.1 zinc finger protein 570-like [Salarias fasciatus]XP_029974675.1 zinc finger protein 570-like [Salarias fasciatus]